MFCCRTSEFVSHHHWNLRHPVCSFMCLFSGISLILGSQIVSASQMVVEETFLKKRNFHPLHVSSKGFDLCNCPSTHFESVLLCYLFSHYDLGQTSKMLLISQRVFLLLKVESAKWEIFKVTFGSICPCNRWRFF